MARNGKKRKKKRTRSRSGKRTRQRKRSGNGGSANAVAEEAASSVMVRSGGRFSLSAGVSGIWDAVCRLMGWSDEEPDEEAQLVDPRVPRISERMDEIFDAALEEKDLGRVILLRRAYDLLGTFLQGIQSATT